MITMLSCNKSEIEELEISDEPYVVGFDASSINSQVESSPLTRAAGETIWYAIQVYKSATSSPEEPYAYGLFDDISNLTISLSPNTTYRIECIIQVCSKGKTYNSGAIKMGIGCGSLVKSQNFTYTNSKSLFRHVSSGTQSIFEGNFFCGSKENLRNVTGLISLDVTQRSSGVKISKEENGSIVDFSYQLKLSAGSIILSTTLGRDEIYYFASTNSLTSSFGEFPIVYATISNSSNTYFNQQINPIVKYLTTIKLIASTSGNFMEINGLSESLPFSKEIIKYL